MFFFLSKYHYLQSRDSSSLETEWLLTSVVDPDPDPDPRGSVLILVCWIRIQEGKKDEQKKIVNKFYVLKCWMVSFEGWRLLL
jgi:hypothetical protein